MNEPDVELVGETIDAIPTIFACPLPTNDRHQLAMFLPYLGGTKESVRKQLSQLSARGFTAISFDPWRTGQRGNGDDRALMGQVFSHFRRHMWPILGQSTLDALHILDWATDHFNVDTRNIVAGGLSTGGDISIALAGIDHRVTRVAAIAATPDWTRPGMHSVTDPDTLIDQGEPTAYGQWLYHQIDPATHPHHYTHGPAIAFELGANDTHVPPTTATEFHTALRSAAPLAAERMRITRHSGLDHLATVQDKQVISTALDWMALS